MDKNEKQRSWEEFTQTGKIGAYLTYRAILAQEQKSHS